MFRAVWEKVLMLRVDEILGAIPMASEVAVSGEDKVKQASAHLYEAMTHKFGPLDLGAHQPLVLAIAEYGEQNRKGDDDGIKRASEHVYEAMTHHFGPMDLGAHQPIVLALAEYGEACRSAGKAS
jgi:hypothetical protein